MKSFNSSGTERQGALSVATGSIYAETVLASGTLSSPAATIDLSSIANTYDELVIRCFARSDRAAGANDGIGLHFNGDTTATNYKEELYAVDGGLTNSNFDDAQIATCPAAPSSPSTLFGFLEVVIPQYAGSKRKIALTRSGRRTDDGGSVDIVLTTLTWENTAAIDRVTLYSTTGNNFDTGTYYQIVGRKATTVVTAVS